MRRLRIVPGESLGSWLWDLPECSVCLLELEEGQERHSCSYCGATFHNDCYKGLLGAKPECPRCRGKLA